MAQMMKRDRSAKERLNRVKQATLAMQRHDWEQGTVAQAFLEAGEAELAIQLAVCAAERQAGDGRCAQLGLTSGVTDPCSVGEALIFARERTGDAALAAALEGLLRWALHRAPRSPKGIVYHLLDSREFWVDSLYMLPPFLARAGHSDEAIRQIDGYWAALYDEEKGLMAHRWDDEKRRFVRRDAWGVGNGWALAGLTRVAALLPEGRERERIVARVRTLLDAVLGYQRSDGLFHNVLDNPDSFPEVNCGQMVAYTIYRGVAAGWLDAGLREAAERCRAAAIRAVDRYGVVRGACGLPDFDRPGVAPEAQAFFIMMEAARGAAGA